MAGYWRNISRFQAYSYLTGLYRPREEKDPLSGAGVRKELRCGPGRTQVCISFASRTVSRRPGGEEHAIKDRDRSEENRELALDMCWGGGTGA